MTRRDVDDRIALVAWAQSGAFSLRQLRAAGGDRALAARRVSGGVWVARGPATWALAASPPNWTQRLWVGHLDMGPKSWVSHAAAARLHVLPLFDARPVELTVPHAGYHRSVVPGTTVHQMRWPWPAMALTHVRGLPVTDIAATYVDLATDRSISLARLLQSAEELVVIKRLSPATLSNRLRHVRRRGRPGVRRMESLIDSLDGVQVHGSVLEARFAALLAAAGEPPLLAQYPVPWRSDRDALTDFADPEVTAFFELDGRTWHDRRAQQLRDRQRDQAAARAGWLPTRFLREQLDDEPETVVATVRAIRLERRGLRDRRRTA